MIERLNAWVGHPLRLFIIVALGVLFTISFLDPHPTVGVPALTSTQHIIGFVVYLTVTVALCIHPKYPDATMGVIACSFTALLVAQVASDFPRVGIPLLYVIYLASANCNPRWRPLWLVWILAGIAVAEMMNDKLLDADAQNYVSAWQLRVTAVVISWIIVGFFWQLGGVARRRQAEHQALQDRAELAAIVERTRIAREMHDIIAHSLTVMIAQADGGKFAGKKNPDMAITALDTIGDVGRSALAEMRQLLSVLRETETPERSLATTPGVAGIGDLIKETRRAGAEVDYTVTGTPHVVRESLGLSVFRIVQECLTNALKHGSANIIMSLDWLSDRLIIVVKNDLGGGLVDPQQLADVPGGRGLIGIAERAKIHGGAAHWGPHAGQWVVEVTLPLGE